MRFLEPLAGRYRDARLFVSRLGFGSRSDAREIPRDAKKQSAGSPLPRAGGAVVVTP